MDRAGATTFHRLARATRVATLLLVVSTGAGCGGRGDGPVPESALAPASPTEPDRTLIPYLDQAGLYGYADRGGTLKVPAQYRAATLFQNGLATVQFADKWGYIRPDGGVQIEGKYDRATSFVSGEACGFFVEEPWTLPIIFLDHIKEGTLTTERIDRTGRVVGRTTRGYWGTLEYEWGKDCPNYRASEFAEDAGGVVVFDPIAASGLEIFAEGDRQGVRKIGSGDIVVPPNYVAMRWLPDADSHRAQFIVGETRASGFATPTIYTVFSLSGATLLEGAGSVANSASEGTFSASLLPAEGALTTPDFAVYDASGKPITPALFTAPLTFRNGLTRAAVHGVPSAWVYVSSEGRVFGDPEYVRATRAQFEPNAR